MSGTTIGTPPVVQLPLHPMLPPPTTPPLTSYIPAYYVRVTGADGEVAGCYKLENYDRPWFDEASLFYTVVTEGVNKYLLIPEKACSFSYKAPPFKACVYDAAESFVESIWGRRLHYSDKNWMASHPLATDDGIPQTSVLSCIHELLTPYELGISRVRLRAGFQHGSKDVQKWTHVLGCNPFGVGDKRTSNLMAAEQLGLTSEEANQLFRLEFHDEPLRPSILCSGAGDLLGHATYLAPRAHAEASWRVSIQVRPLHGMVAYLEPPAVTPYKPRHGSRTLLLTQTKAPDGAVINPWLKKSATSEGAYYKPGDEKPYSYHDSYWDRDKKHDKKENKDKRKGNGKGISVDRLCLGCGSRQGAKQTKLCAECREEWDHLWSPYKCSNKSCGLDFSSRSPLYAGPDSTKPDRLLVACPRCADIYFPPEDDAELVSFCNTMLVPNHGAKSLPEPRLKREPDPNAVPQPAQESVAGFVQSVKDKQAEDDNLSAWGI